MNENATATSHPRYADLIRLDARLLKLQDKQARFGTFAPAITACLAEAQALLEANADLTREGRCARTLLRRGVIA